MKLKTILFAILCLGGFIASGAENTIAALPATVVKPHQARRMDLTDAKAKIIGLATGVVGAFVWNLFRGPRLRDRWALENGFQILHSNRRRWRAGPFTWTRSLNQIVYLVHVRDYEGSERSGWVRCGSYRQGWGISDNQFEVSWNDES